MHGVVRQHESCLACRTACRASTFDCQREALKSYTARVRPQCVCVWSCGFLYCRYIKCKISPRVRTKYTLKGLTMWPSSMSIYSHFYMGLICHISHICNLSIQGAEGCHEGPVSTSRRIPVAEGSECKWTSVPNACPYTQRLPGVGFPKSKGLL